MTRDWSTPTASDAVSGRTEEKHVREATRLTARLIYEVIRRDGAEELARPWQSLVFSGLAAGLLISFSVIGEAVLSLYLPDAGWRPLVENLGYSLGFLIVILGRMQLFTENTITTVLPVITDFSRQRVWQMTRLWVVVLLANSVGTVLAGGFIAWSGAFAPDLLARIGDMAHHLAHYSAYETFARGIPAGVLVAGIVWMLPSGTGATFFIILTFTWLIAVCDFTHVIAGSVEIAYIVVTGDLAAASAFFGFFLPVLAGNVVGGTVVFTLLTWGQVQKEV